MCQQICLCVCECVGVQKFWQILRTMFVSTLNRKINSQYLDADQSANTTNGPKKLCLVTLMT